MESAEDFIKRKEEEYKIQKEIPLKDIGRKGKHFFIREAWFFMRQHNLPEKVFVFERLRRTRVEGDIVHIKSRELGDVEYRFGYYIIGKTGNRNGKWTWGQYCPLIPIKDFDKLIDLAKKKGVLL
ncbi:hypothetical protein HYU09_02275 [Candidatus Woesearchaeota archaeon]|nr:hypothetical protein [Candidatus Woesearchaeota archaeon]